MLRFRKPTIDDIELYYDWANDQEVRQQSYNSNPIDHATHIRWFESAIQNDAYSMYIFQDLDKNDVGQVRIQKQTESTALIGISIDLKYRGKGYAKEMLLLATDIFFKSNEDFIINAYIKQSNINSKFSFENAGFEFNNIVDYENHRSFHFIKVKK